ncbi:MAG: Stp1/IreP family PP2C-type Ser/Thr phosphatase [Actinomycetota bacterium]|nr:Stp1/IreP family PP2C-type Ser/Thr phosphatase [Actinomycetota bacterium]
MRLEGASASHVGQARDNNQDRALYTGTLGAVADGMGGHVGGEKAAAMAIAEFNGVRGVLSEQRLIDVVQAANRRIYDAALQPLLRGMGTTIVVASFDPVEQVVTIVNVGDSRGYLLREGDFRQVTVDHSLVEDLIREGQITEEEARVHPQRNIVTRALGIMPEVEVDAFAVRVQAGDRLLLASDGLSNEVAPDGIASILVETTSSDDACRQLVDAALAGGGRDNVTVVVLDVVEDGAVVADASSAATLTPVGEHADNFLADIPRPSKRRLPLRSVLILLGVVVVLVGASAGTAWYARSGYFADELDGSVAIFRGRPGGVLWFKPTEEELTEIRVDELDGASRTRLEQRPVWSTLSDARDFVDNLDTSRLESTVVTATPGN